MDFAVSCGLLIKSEVLKKVGLFDPGYRFYYEDIDFSQRARNEGFRVRFVPEARMYARERQEWKSTDEVYDTWGESFARFYRRHVRPLGLRLPVHLGYLVLREALTGHAAQVPALLRGVIKGFQKPLGNIPRLESDFIQLT